MSRASANLAAEVSIGRVDQRSGSPTDRGPDIAPTFCTCPPRLSSCPPHPGSSLLSMHITKLIPTLQTELSGLLHQAVEVLLLSLALLRAGFAAVHHRRRHMRYDRHMGVRLQAMARHGRGKRHMRGRRDVEVVIHLRRAGRAGKCGLTSARRG